MENILARQEYLNYRNQSYLISKIRRIELILSPYTTDTKDKQVIIRSNRKNTSVDKIEEIPANCFENCHDLRKIKLPSLRKVA